jgi:hypothetical protein
VKITPRIVIDDDDYEPNDKLDNSSVIKIGETVYANLSKTNDEDWYRLSVEEDSDLKIVVESTSTRFDPVAQIYTEDNKIVFESDNYSANSSEDFVVKFNK